MTEINLEKLKALELELLKQFHDICIDENLRYSLGGGTLLGAVRHKGFIPWDDDIDVMMPRPDYEKFIDYCKNHNTPFAVKSHETDKTYVDLSAKIYNPDTILIDSDIAGSNDGIGVFIDLFIIDGLGNTKKQAVKAFRATSFKRELLVAAQWKKFFRSKTRAFYYEPIRFAMFLLSRCIDSDKIFCKIEKKYKKINFDSVNYAAAVGGSYREREIHQTRLFTEFIDLPFENYEFKGIADYDTYLKSNYGDYMALPPANKRIAHHTFKAYYKEAEDEICIP